MHKFIGIFRNTAFLKLFLANLTSQIGSVIGLTAFTFYLLDRFSSQPLYATITELMFSLPTLFIFFLVGVVADRMNRQRVAYYCDIISVILSIFLLGALYLGWMPLMFAILFFRSGVQKFFFPAEQGLIQGTLPKEDYGTAAGLNQMVGSMFNLFGTGMGVLIYWLVGIYGAIIVDALSFFVSALFIKAGVFSEKAKIPNGQHSWKDLKIGIILKDFKDGFQYIIHYKLLLALLGGFIVLGIVNGGFTVMPIYILKYKLVPSTYEEMSIILGIVIGSGMLIGSFLASIIVQKFKFYQLAVFGLAVTGGSIIASSIVESVWLFLCLMFVLALAIPFINVAIGGWLPGIIDPKMMGRVQGWISPFMMFSQSITLGFIAIGYPKFVSIETLYWIVGTCLLLVSFFYWMVLPRLSEQQQTVKESTIISSSV
ncbi:MFS transporter [Bacillus sp. 2205SS5-2]|uniref:MFS transporter n=1 Tax=Bacillus sp. 2205SS5-2 TaxID=3109031 RepID=UPI00300424FC